MVLRERERVREREKIVDWVMGLLMVLRETERERVRERENSRLGTGALDGPAITQIRDVMLGLGI